MTDSDFVFERGEPIDHGEHGDHDLAYHKGSPVLDDGDSSLVFEVGTGLGSGFDTILLYRQGQRDNEPRMADFETWVESNTPHQVESYKSPDGTRFHEAADQVDPDTVVLWIVTDGDNTPNSEDLDKASSLQSNGVAFVVCVEDASASSPATANEFTNAIFGSPGFREGFNSKTGDSGQCETGSGNHPVFDNVGSLPIFSTEGDVEYGEISETYSDTGYTNYDAFGEHDPLQGGRVFLEGSWQRFDPGLDSCDNNTYITNLLDWLQRRI